jgi:D-3-phosphoglycerate dehydrogenase / 2-oxoglutarate reductase
VDDVKEGNWDRSKFRGVNLHGKSLGILGLGRIGKQIAFFAQAFGMKVSAFDPYQKEWLEGVQKTDSPEALFSSSDFLIILINASNNYKFVSAELLQKVKKGAFLVNTSRGSVWDEKAVVDLLLASYLGGVATDVITNETEPSKRVQSPLLAYNGKLKNLIITPHLAGATRESMQAVEEYLAQKFLQLVQSSN